MCPYNAVFKTQFCNLWSQVLPRFERIASFNPPGFHCWGPLGPSELELLLSRSLSEQALEWGVVLSLPHPKSRLGVLTSYCLGARHVT